MMILEKGVEIPVENEKPMLEMEPIPEMPSEIPNGFFSGKTPGAERIGVPFGEKEGFHEMTPSSRGGMGAVLILQCADLVQNALSFENILFDLLIGRIDFKGLIPVLDG